MHIMHACLALVLCSLVSAGEIGGAGGEARLRIDAEGVDPLAVRRAIDRDLRLLIARQPGGDADTWTRLLADRCTAMLRSSGYRQAEAGAVIMDGSTILTIRAADRRQCGRLVITGDEATAALLREHLTQAQQAAAEGDLDSAPRMHTAAWSPDQPVSWQPEALAQLERRLQAHLRSRGRFGLRVDLALDSGEAGYADLRIAILQPAMPASVGSVVPGGALADHGAALRDWLALPPGSPADDATARLVRERLRGCGSYTQIEVRWEDTPRPDLSLPPAELERQLAAARETADRRILARGTADLIVAARLIDGRQHPWAPQSREIASLLQARQRTLQRLGGDGAALVLRLVRDQEPDERVVWSPRHGIAVLRPDGRCLAITGGGVAAAAPGGPAGRVQIPGCWISTGIGADADGTGSLKLTAGFSTAQPGMRILADLEPAGLRAIALEPRKGSLPPTITWNGDTMVVARITEGGQRMSLTCDPATGIAVEIAGADGRWLAALEDGAWEAQVAPALARTGDGPGSASSACAAAVACMRGAWFMPRDGSADRILGMIGTVAASGLPDAIAAAGTPQAATDTTLQIPDDGSWIQAPAMMMALAQMCLTGDQQLARRLSEQAWPRHLLRGTARVLVGDGKRAVQGLRHLFEDRGAGPLAFWLHAEALRLARVEPLARACADQALRRWNAAGWSGEADTLLPLADELGPVIALLAGDDAGTGREAEARDRLRAALLRLGDSVIGAVLRERLRWIADPAPGTM